MKWTHYGSPALAFPSGERGGPGEGKRATHGSRHHGLDVLHAKHMLCFRVLLLAPPPNTAAPARTAGGLGLAQNAQFGAPKISQHMFRVRVPLWPVSPSARACSRLMGARGGVLFFTMGSCGGLHVSSPCPTPAAILFSPARATAFADRESTSVRRRAHRPDGGEDRGGRGGGGTAAAAESTAC